MHSDLIYKLSLVTSSGLNLAEVPESEDSAKAQLSGGITSAILTFSREIHERDIEHMSYHDRSVVFVQVSDLIIVVEISSTLDRNLLDKFVHFFKDKVKVHLQNVNVDTLTPAQAKKILSDIHDADWLHLFLQQLGFEQSLTQGSEIVIEIEHENNGTYKLIHGDDQPFLKSIAWMIHERNVNNKIEELHTCGFVMLNKYNKAAFAISQNKNIRSKAGLIVVDDNIATTLFRMSPLLLKIAMKKLDDDPFYPFELLLSDLKEVHDIDPTERVKDTFYNLPLTYLEQNINRVDQALFPITSGERVVIVGEKEKVQNIIDLLLIFNQHLISDVFYYYETGETLNNDIIGMSKEDCDRLIDEGILDESATRIILEKKSVEGENAKSNKFLKNLYDRTKSLPVNQAIDVIYRELELVVSYAITATSHSVLSKNEALKGLEQLKSSINDASQYEIIQLLATKQNIWLSAVVHDEAFDQDWI